MKKPHHYKEILDKLELMWKHERDIDAITPFFDEPLDDLMLTVLSQNTNDRNRDKAFDKLRAKYPTWNEAAEASVKDIADCIRVAGLGDTKAARMKEILATIREKFGEYSIKSMENWDTEEARSFLISLPGVGAKTAGVVLVFDLGKAAFPVDTHISRISRRLGWVEEKTPPDKIQEYLEATLQPERFGGAHLNMIEHGRRICDARKPLCVECPLNTWCKFAKSLDVI